MKKVKDLMHVNILETREPETNDRRLSFADIPKTVMAATSMFVVWIVYLMLAFFR